MQIVSTGDNLHEMTKPVFLGKEKKYFNMPSAEKLTQCVKRKRTDTNS